MNKNKPCPEEWDKMEQRGGNKFCNVCSKDVVDLTQTSWEDIYSLQKATNFKTCGRYTSKQFEEYPKEMSKRNLVLKPIAAAAAILISMTNLSAQSAPQISGKITNENNEPLPFCSIQLKDTDFITISDLEGNFQLSADTSYSINSKATLIVHSFGYEQKSIPLYKEKDSLNINLPESEKLDEIIIEIKMEEHEFKGMMTVGMIEVLPAKKSFLEKRKDFIKVGKRDNEQF